jgi:hypothetical protein
MLNNLTGLCIGTLYYLKFELTQISLTTRTSSAIQHSRIAYLEGLVSFKWIFPDDI